MRASLGVALLALAMVCPDWAFSQQPRQLSIKQFMTAQEFKAAGLEKLSSAEFQALEKWFNRHTLHIYRVAQEQGSPPSGGRGYLVEHAVNDETFIINGNVYKAKLYCMTLNRGDRVIFAEGSPHGACVSAKLVNLRNGDICELWCE